MKLAIVVASSTKRQFEHQIPVLAEHIGNEKEVEEIVLIADKTEKWQKKLSKTTTAEVRTKELGNTPGDILFQVGKTIHTSRPDAVLFDLSGLENVGSWNSMVYGVLSSFTSKIKGIPTISILPKCLEDVEDRHSQTQKRRWVDIIAGALRNIPTKLMLMSDLVAVANEELLNYLERKFEIRNGAVIPMVKNEFSSEPDYGFPGGPIRLVTMGGFGTEGDMDSLINEVEQLRKKMNRDIEITIAGMGTFDRCDFAREMNLKYGEMPFVSFLDIVKDAEPLSRAFRESTAVILNPDAGYTENLDIIRLAGILGKATAIPCSDSAVMDKGYAGEIFDPEEFGSLATGLRNILAYDAYRIHLGQKNYRAMCANSVISNAGEYLDFFKAIMIKKSKTPVLHLDYELTVA